MGSQFSSRITIMRTGILLGILSVVTLGEYTVNSYALHRAPSHGRPQHNEPNSLAKALLDSGFRPRRSVGLDLANLQDLQLTEDILAAEKLATGILTDVQSVLRDFRHTGENRQFWNLMEDAIGKICKKNLLSLLILFLINFSDAANDAAA